MNWFICDENVLEDEETVEEAIDTLKTVVKNEVMARSLNEIKFYKKNFYSCPQDLQEKITVDQEILKQTRKEKMKQQSPYRPKN